MTIMVTGASGVVGNSVSEYLQKQGFDVIGIYHTTLPYAPVNAVLKCDLTNKEEVDQLPNCDVILHIAAALEGTAVEMVHNNILATENLLRRAERMKECRFFYISTISVYGQSALKLDIDSDICNSDIYGMTKYLSEKLVKESCLSQKMVIRLPRMLGKYINMDISGSGFLLMVSKLLVNDTVTCYIPNVVYNNFLHVEDLAKWCKILINNKPGGGYTEANLGVPDYLTMSNILEILKRGLKSKSKLINDDRGVIPKCSCISIEQALELGFNPMSAEETLLKFARDLNPLNKNMKG